MFTCLTKKYPRQIYDYFHSYIFFNLHRFLYHLIDILKYWFEIEFLSTNPRDFTILQYDLAPPKNMFSKDLISSIYLKKFNPIVRYFLRYRTREIQLISKEWF